MPSTSAPPLPPGPPNYYLMRHLRRASRDPIGFYRSAWESYGDFVRIHWYGPFSAYLAVHPDSVEQVLQANWSNYTKGFFYKRLSVFTGQGLFTSEGDLWLKQRRLAQPAFHRQKVANLTGSMAATVGEMLDDWDREDLKEPFDLASEMMKLTLRVAGKALFGTDLDATSAHWLHQRMNTAMIHVEYRFNPLTLPESVPTPRNRRYLAAKLDLDGWILGLARRRRESGIPGDDLLQMLLDARDETSGEGMSDQQMVDEVITLLVAGHETSADALAWGLSLLARNPGSREALEHEADEVLNGHLPTLETLPLLPQASMAFLETLRLYPPIWALAREAKTDDKIAGYTVPARSTVMIPPYFTHRHPEFWPHPENFDPQRFLPGQVARRHKFAYYPFGGGPRLCIGQQFALYEGQIALAAIVNRYRLELAPQEKLEMHPSLALRPRNGLWMTRTPRT